MREKLKQYVDRLFVQKKQTEQMRELHDEILQNSFDRYDDEIARGKSPEEAYRAAVDGIGDLAPILCDDMAAAEMLPLPSGCILSASFLRSSAARWGASEICSDRA